MRAGVPFAAAFALAMATMAPRADAKYCLTLDAAKGTWWLAKVKMYYGSVWSETILSTGGSICSGDDATGMMVEKVDPVQAGSVLFKREQQGECTVEVWGPLGAMYFWHQGVCGNVKPDWARPGVR